MRRRHFLRGSASLLAMPAIVRAASASTLRFVPYTDLAIIDPMVTTGLVTRTHALIVFDTLYGLDEGIVPRPQMVDGHVIEDDGRRWRLTLREGLRFHDNTPVLARDVVASLNRWMSRDPFGAGLLAATDELAAPSDRVVQFRLKRPFPFLPAALARTTGYVPGIMPARLAATPAQTPVPELIGSGPFAWAADERVPGSLAVYRRFAGYVPRPDGVASFTAGPRAAYFDRIEWQTLPDPSTAASALQRGEVDWWEQPTIDLMPMLRADRNVTVKQVEGRGLMAQMRLNHLYPPFDNPAIRRAVLGCISQTDCMEAVASEDRSLWQDGVGFFTPGSPLASSAGMEAITRPRNIAAGRQALKDAGYDGEPVTMLVGADVPRINAIAQVSYQACRDIGLNVQQVNADWGTVLGRVNNAKPVAEGGWNMYPTFSSGIDFWTPAAHSTLRGNGLKGVSGWPTIPLLEILRDKWLMTESLAEQQAICRDMQLEAFRAVPYVPLGLFRQPTVFRSDLQGMLVGQPVFTNLRRG
jgi:peptide/nickel transport system substrate-binding protein